MAICGKICKVLCCKCSSSESLEPATPISPPPSSAPKKAATLVQPKEEKGKNQGLDNGNKEYSDYITSAKAKIRTTSIVGGGPGGDRGGDGGSSAAAAHSGKSVTRRDSLNDKFTDYIVRAKNKITKTSTIVGRSVAIK